MNVAYNMDCMEAMRQMPDKFYELGVCDPPYGVGMDGGNIGYKGFNGYVTQTVETMT
jgi:site-specific DNA-methyltransferase (adenine-specific)